MRMSNLAIGNEALVASSLPVDQASYHVAGSLACSKLFILSAKEPAPLGMELIFGQLDGVLA